MTIIAIEFDAELAEFVARVEPGLLPNESHGALWLSYDEALRLYSTLGELIRSYEYKYGHSERYKTT